MSKIIIILARLATSLSVRISSLINDRPNSGTGVSEEFPKTAVALFARTNAMKIYEEFRSSFH